MRKNSRWLIPMVIAGLFAGCWTSDHSVPVDRRTVRLYGTTVGNGVLGESILVQLSPDDGSFLQTIGPVGYYVNGLEYDPVHHKLYGTTSSNDPVFPDGLIEIDRTTGAGTPIGAGAGMLINNPTVDSAGEMYAWTENSDDLVTVDTATGVATVVGVSGIGTFEHGLAFGANDNLILVNGDGAIYTIDPVSGAGTYVTDIGQRAHHGDVHPKTGLYWGIDETWYTVPGPGGQRNLLVVDVAAGAITATLPSLDDLHAITFFYE